MGSSCRRRTSCPAPPSGRAPCATLCVSAPRRHGPASRGPCWASGDLGPGAGGGCHLCAGCKPCLPRGPVRDGCSLSPADLVGFGWSKATDGCSRDRRGRQRGCRRATATAGSPLAAAATRRKAEAPNRPSTTTTRAVRHPSTPSGGSRWDRAAAFAGNSRWQPWFGLSGSGGAKEEVVVLRATRMAPTPAARVRDGMRRPGGGGGATAIVFVCAYCCGGWGQSGQEVRSRSRSRSSLRFEVAGGSRAGWSLGYGIVSRVVPCPWLPVPIRWWQTAEHPGTQELM